MIIDYVAEKVNQITWNVAAEGDGVSENMAQKKQNVKDEPGDIYWYIDTQVDGTAYLAINFLEASDIYEVEFATNGRYENIEVQWSLDADFTTAGKPSDEGGANWYTLPKGTLGWTGYQDIRAAHIRLLFTNVKAGFELTSWRIVGDQPYNINQELISLIARRFYPQRFFEQKQMIPETVETFLQMLERNDRGQTIVPWIEGECTVETYLIFDEGDEGSGSINANFINSIPINSGGPTTFTGLGTAVINRIAGGGAFYDINGWMDPGLSLRFNSIVECDFVTPSEKINYRWEFNDPFESSSNPSTVPVPEYGEIKHVFTRLGVYDVEFIVLKNGRTFKDTQRVEISPSPYVILGKAFAAENEEYTVYGLTKYPGNHQKDQPTGGDGTYAPAILTYTNNDPIPANIAYLVDNGDRTFIVKRPGLIAGQGKIRIWDEWYEEWAELVIYFDNPLLDHEDDPVTDAGNNTIYTN